MAAPRSDFEREMQVLEGEIKRLEAEYNMYFSGRLPRLPWDTRNRVEARVKRFDRMHIQNTADRFRFSTLQTRYAMFCELWERQLKAMEGGRPRIGRLGAPPPAPVAPPPEPEPAAPPPRRERAAPPDGVVHVAKVRDPNAESDRVKELYEQLAAAKRQTGEAPVAFDRVAALVRAQVDKLREQGQDASFRVAVKDGKVSLTVKPATNDE